MKYECTTVSVVHNLSEHSVYLINTIDRRCSSALTTKLSSTPSKIEIFGLICI